ncbi:hypothetical protein SBA1_140038 [Candidatus Sulfotelmatobacter kueseliae]|uniref:Uncharacterized protein n=1 Tax=Candidatus Sulfotelmatobacter kueseliae TaxID=2042962 RepID=A0A2U3K6A4_9BACT|nr:hypothetical protein SBA1_140038 [Candidatus Sulfotelmatobacter kueseliae]
MQHMDDRRPDRQTSKENTADKKPAREIQWSFDRNFQGWTCSQCEWNYPVPTLLNDPEAKNAYDRLASAKFREHKCADHPTRMTGVGPESFTSRIRKMVAHGYKPKDAVDLVVQEVAIEYPNQPKILDQARAEGEDFLRRLRAGLI